MFLIIFGAFAPEGFFKHGSAFVLVRPNLNFCIHLLTIVFIEKMRHNTYQAFF